MGSDPLTDHAACSDEPFYHFVKRLVSSFISYQLMVRGHVSRQWIIPRGFPLHLSFLLQMVCAFLLSILRLRELQVMSGSQSQTLDKENTEEYTQIQFMC